MKIRKSKTRNWCFQIILMFFVSLGVFGQNKTGSVEHSNKFYNYKVDIPVDWSIYGEIKNDTVRKFSIISWGLPKVQDSILDQNVENSISITAYKRPSIKSISDLTLNERLRNDPTKTSMIWDPDGGDFQRIYHSDKGIEYFGKAYYKFNNGIGYVIVFMATEGTYKKNVEKFNEFYTSFRFLSE